eukprot:6077103-Ditylum_brightwellii.AAC.1
MKEGEDEEATTEMENSDDENLLSTSFIHIKRKNEPNYTPLVDINDPSFCKRKTQFKVQKIDPATGRQHTVVPIPLVLLDHFPPLVMITSAVLSSNKHRAERKRTNPDLKAPRKERLLGST